MSPAYGPFIYQSRQHDHEGADAIIGELARKYLCRICRGQLRLGRQR